MEEYIDFAKVIEKFMNQSKTTNLKTKDYIEKYQNLKVVVSFGKGNVARIPWISFLAENQTTSNGIYPVLLYYKKFKTIILSYGISETNKPAITWNIDNRPTIKEFFKERNQIPDRYGASYVYSSYDTTKPLNYKQIVNDLDKLVSEYKLILGKSNTGVQEPNPPFKPTKNTKPRTIRNFSIAEIIKSIKSTGLIYSDNIIKRFAFSLMTKPFVILSGLAGSGKTQLAIAFANALCEDIDKQICFVPVGADWTNREPLLGYPNALNTKEYIKPENGVLDIIINANKDPEKPYFLILDEMNLSYVERYFADFLSAMESKKEISLWNNDSGLEIPSKVLLPKNLYIIGTINVDETTYMFSPKVLDRANVIEFKISEKEMESFLENSTNVDTSRIIGTNADMGYSFVTISQENKFTDEDKNLASDMLKNFFKELKQVNAEFGYRSASEIFKFINIASQNDDSNDKLSEDNILDFAILQKLLPKLHGSRKKLDKTLNKLWNLCFIDEPEPLNTADTIDLENVKYKESADKILRMYKVANENGFTSFAEA